MIKIKEFYDQLTGALTYVVSSGKNCVIIDPILNYNQFSGKISHDSADEVVNFIKKEGLDLVWILETHIHADHITACEYIKKKALTEGFGKKVQSAIGENVIKVNEYWGGVFEFEDKSLAGADDFDKLLKDGEKIKLGETEIEIISTPGHTPCCVSYKIGNDVFVGDVIFAPDVGTARCDFPGGNVQDSYKSIQKIYGLGDDVKLYTGHDYPFDKRKLQFYSTVREQKEENILVADHIDEKKFAELRKKKDATLPAPKLLYQALQVNIFAGKIDGKKFLKIPITN